MIMVMKMKVTIIEEDSKNKKRKFFVDWLAHMIGYAIVLILASIIFPKTVYIDNSGFGIWALVAAIITSLLNETVKPFIVLLTLPLTSLTLGLFYPFVNVLILNIVSFILGSHFNLGGLIMSFIVAIFISIMNLFVDRVVENILRKR